VRRLRFVAILSVLALVLAACGRDEETTEAGDTGTTGQPSDGTSGDGEELGLDDGAFGDLGVVCQEAPEGETLTAGSDPGVTADSIQISTFSDPGFPGRLGLNQEMFDTAEAFTNWCNEHGGINGRKIDLKLRDAKLTEFQQRVIEACDEGDFMSVGGGAVFDDTGQADRLACGLPVIYGYAVTATAADADLGIQPIPNPGNQQPVGAMKWIEEQFPDSVQAVGIFAGQLETTQVVGRRNKEAMEQLGWRVVHEDSYNAAGEQTWRPFLESMKAAGVRGLYWVGEPANLSKLLSEAAGVGITFDWVLSDANHYDPQIPEVAGESADGLYVRTAIHPFLTEEDAAGNEATMQYRELIDRYDPGGKIAYLGVQALSSWLLFAKAASECGVDITRDCVWEKAQEITEWTGGGLHAPQNLAEKTASNCFALLVVEGGTFQTVDVGATDGIYNCEEGNVVELEGDYGTGARCPNPAFADDPKPSNCAT
jgi:ABC-type branched-subunit amino acid transport system substrate-binding protein